MSHQLGTFDGQRKGAAEFNPFFPAEQLDREFRSTVETHHWLKDAIGILALFAFFAMLGLWTGAL